MSNEEILNKHKLRQEALEFLSNEIPNTVAAVQTLKYVAIVLQQYEVAADLRIREKELVLANGENN